LQMGRTPSQDEFKNKSTLNSWSNVYKDFYKMYVTKHITEHCYFLAYYNSQPHHTTVVKIQQLVCNRPSSGLCTAVSRVHTNISEELAVSVFRVHSFLSTQVEMCNPCLLFSKYFPLWFCIYDCLVCLLKTQMFWYKANHTTYIIGHRIRNYFHCFLLNIHCMKE
jgi:hypothetical protein